MKVGIWQILAGFIVSAFGEHVLRVCFATQLKVFLPGPPFLAYLPIPQACSRLQRKTGPLLSGQLVSRLVALNPLVSWDQAQHPRFYTSVEFSWSLDHQKGGLTVLEYQDIPVNQVLLRDLYDHKPIQQRIVLGILYSTTQGFMQCIILRYSCRIETLAWNQPYSRRRCISSSSFWTYPGWLLSSSQLFRNQVRVC